MEFKLDSRVQNPVNILLKEANPDVSDALCKDMCYRFSPDYIELENCFHRSDTSNEARLCRRVVKIKKIMLLLTLYTIRLDQLTENDDEEQLVIMREVGRLIGMHKRAKNELARFRERVAAAQK